MSKEIVERGAASQISHVFIPDSASTTGGGKTGLAHDAAGLKIVVMRPGESAPTKYLQSASNIETISTLGTYQTPSSNKCRFKEIDATDLPGWYELHFADALYDATNNRRSLGGMISGASGVVPTPFQIQLADPVRGVGSPTAIPNVASGSANSLARSSDGSASTPQTGDSYAIVSHGTNGNAAIKTQAAAIEADTQDLQNRTPAALVAGRMDSSVGAMATDVLSAAAVSGAAVTKIQTGLSTLDATAIRAALGLASANLDTVLALIASYIDTEIQSIKNKTDLIPASPAAVGSAMTLEAGERDAIAAALLDLANGIETGYTLRAAQRLILSAAAGKVSGADTETVVLRDVNDTVNRLTATTDQYGNRSAVSRNVA